MPAISSLSPREAFLKEWQASIHKEILNSPCTPVQVPEITVVERVFDSLKAHSILHPDKLAVTEAFNLDRSLTFKQIHDQALSFAGFLISQGITVGERMTAALMNSIELPVLHLGAWAAGVAVVGSSAIYKLYDTVYQLQDSASSVVVTSEPMLETMIEAAKQCPSVKLIICIRSTEKALPAGVFDFMEVLIHKPLEKIIPVTMDTESTICYSSGTTGQPKGVIHTHKTFHCHIEILRSHWTHEIYPKLGVDKVCWHEESQIITSSCLHLLGFTMLNWFLITGSPIVLMKSFDGDIYEQTIERFQPRFLIMTPPMFAYLAKNAKGKAAPLSSVKMIMCTTAPLSQELSNEFLACHPHVMYIVQGYGMTEANFSHLPLLLEEGANASGGVVASLFQQKIIDPESRRPCQQGKSGEVCVRGPSQTTGYLNKPEAMQSLIDEEGWIHTGDIGYIDERGLLYIVDRKKELIKVNFLNQNLQVSPAEIEGVLLSHSKVQDAAIIGVSNEAGGELVRAFVVKADKNITEKEVEGLVSDKLAEFKRITGGVVFVDTIPRSATGKILRRILQETTGAKRD